MKITLCALLSLLVSVPALADLSTRTTHWIGLDAQDTARLRDTIQMGVHDVLLGSTGDSDVMINCNQRHSAGRCGLQIMFGDADSWVRVEGPFLIMNLRRLNASYPATLHSAFRTAEIHEFRSLDGRLIISCASPASCIIQAPLL